MTEQTKPPIASGQPAGETDESDIGIPDFQRTPGQAEGEDPANPLSKPQGSQQDQEKNMESEGQLVRPPSTEAG
jgi:hypothetical protein